MPTRSEEATIKAGKRRRADRGRTSQKELGSESQVSDRSLVEAIQERQGHENAFRILFERYRLPIAQFFKNRGFSDEECRDLTQETFLRAFRGLRNFRFDSSFKTWLYRIARSLWSNTVRDRGALKRSADVIPLEELEARDGPGANLPEIEDEQHARGPLDRVIVEQHSRLLRDAIASLPSKQQRLILLQVFQGLKINEIAVVLKMPQGTVKSLLSRTRARLKRKLEGLCSDIDSPASGNIE